MRNLFAFLFRYRGILVFGLLEVLSLYLLIRNSAYQRAAFFNSANSYVGQVLDVRTRIYDYFRLVDVNRGLVAENALLRQQLYRSDLSNRVADSLPVSKDSVTQARLHVLGHPDSLLLGLRPLPAHDPDYPLIPARVINNSLRNVDNYITLNVGSRDGVKNGMGVVAAAGVVGRIKVTSEHYATATSLLHSKTLISAKIQRDGTQGAIKWLGDDPTHALLDNIPRQNKLVRGDTIVTSGFNAVFPEGILIGTIDSFVKEPDKNFWTVRVRLAVNFSNLTYVYVVSSRPKAERDTIETRAGMKPEEEDRP
ncbi:MULTISPECIES: rod shape-determining protein MreC [Hymenobacter]|uniref:Cell shape-determining protein MreC n=1 Tax=Hymenobacter jejuensis TaxID=2502781 RepID=A0A5B7ZXA6_9BACT|nr:MULTISPECIES: rod shape-determining protein MreC [Hymenobacter]MBC6992450.1 rod shape-determining protein MreC [Hymenobacter sp. BT491]QDA59610.1 rod shape-determining protein MreC [Hymenobacter jejuensis]